MKSLTKKKILITGISGFVGKHLNAELAKRGATVFGVSRIKSKNKNTLTSDILDYSRINNYVKKNKIDSIIHLAGESIVESGQTDPYTTFKTNTEGTLNVLEIGKNNKLNKIIIASTSHVYGKNKVPYYEGYMPRPSRPYETSKACTDLIAQSYAETFNLPVLIPRFVNIYGPGDMNFTRLIPKTIRSLLKNEHIKIWGGDAVRDFLYIDDAVSSYIDLLTVDIEKFGKNRIINFGTGNKITIQGVIEKIIQISGMNPKIERVIDKRELEIKEQYVSVAKAKRLLNWSSKIEFDEGLKTTFKWYEENIMKL